MFLRFFVVSRLKLCFSLRPDGLGSCPLFVPRTHLHLCAQLHYLSRLTLYDAVLMKAGVTDLTLPHNSLDTHERANVARMGTNFNILLQNDPTPPPRRARLTPCPPPPP